MGRHNGVFDVGGLGDAEFGDIGDSRPLARSLFTRSPSSSASPSDFVMSLRTTTRAIGDSVGNRIRAASSTIEDYFVSGSSSFYDAEFEQSPLESRWQKTNYTECIIGGAMRL